MKRTTITKRHPAQGLLATVLFFFFLISCTEADVTGDNSFGQQQPGEVETTFHFEVSDSQAPVTRSITFTAQGSTETDTLSIGEATSVADTLQTRAATELPDEQEKKVANLWIGQYDASGNRLSNQYIEAVTGTQVTAKLVVANNCKVRFVANAGNLEAIETETLLDAKTLAYASTADGRPQSNLFAMTGEWTGNITGSTTPQTIPSVTLTRLAAKITFTYKINGEGFTFTPTSISLKNVPNCSQIGTLSPGNRPASATYTTSYNGTISKTGATMYWYLPENMAGTGTPPVSTEKEKKGDGVTNATYIELLGDAIQNGVPYTDVAFRFYPGRDENDYNIERNDHFIMSIDLKGLDISDKRITVGTIPSITVSPAGNFPVLPGATKEVQITSRAGTIWSLPLPSWLSATIDGQTIPPGSTLTNQGPCKVTFKTTEVNPNSEAREQPFAVNLDEKGTQGSFTLTQDPSTVTVSKSTLKMTEYTPTSGTITVNGTPGLKWTISPAGETNGITPVFSSPTSDGTDQLLTFKATANPDTYRKVPFTISASGGDHSLTVVVKQPANPIVIIDERMLVSYYKQMKSDHLTWAQCPPFDKEGFDTAPSHKLDVKLTDPPSMRGSYSIQVQQRQNPDFIEYDSNYCNKLDMESFNDWRMPTQIELHAMWYKCRGENNDTTDDEEASLTLGDRFIAGNYWSSTLYNGQSDHRCILFFGTGSFFDDGTGRYYVRCVRDISVPSN